VSEQALTQLRLDTNRALLSSDFASPDKTRTNDDCDQQEKKEWLDLSEIPVDQKHLAHNSTQKSHLGNCRNCPQDSKKNCKGQSRICMLDMPEQTYIHAPLSLRSIVGAIPLRAALVGRPLNTLNTNTYYKVLGYEMFRFRITIIGLVWKSFGT
jgi:hypothetical protein